MAIVAGKAREVTAAICILEGCWALRDPHAIEVIPFLLLNATGLPCCLDGLAPLIDGTARGTRPRSCFVALLFCTVTGDFSDV